MKPSTPPPDSPGAKIRAAAGRPERRRVLTSAAVLAATAMAPGRRAEAADTPAGTAPVMERPFVDHRLVLQLSDREAPKQAMILSVAYNLLENYGLDHIDIEAVAFGPGIDLLRADSPYRAKVDSLVAQNVRFSVCMNTVNTIERETGVPIALNPLARKVKAGVARILALSEAGYTVVRP
ncbi:MAG: hypothetical protein KGQ35_04555 [Burkholderiales bacterium]|nr:hypothetical protein [Burkholderiales bacterium]